MKTPPVIGDPSPCYLSVPSDSVATAPLTLVAESAGMPVGSRIRIVAVDPFGTGHSAGDTTLHWSPDRQGTVFISTRDGNADIYAMNSVRTCSC